MTSSMSPVSPTPAGGTGPRQRPTLAQLLRRFDDFTVHTMSFPSPYRDR